MCAELNALLSAPFGTSARALPELVLASDFVTPLRKYPQEVNPTAFWLARACWRRSNLRGAVTLQALLATS